MNLREFNIASCSSCVNNHLLSLLSLSGGRKSEQASGKLHDRVKSNEITGGHGKGRAELPRP